MNDKNFNHREYMTKIIETYLSEMFKHYNEISLTVLEVSHWKDIISLGEERNHRNICHAMKEVRFKHSYTSGKYESTTYELKYLCS